MTDRYWFDNSLSDEGTRLRLLEKIADPRSISLLNGLGVAPGSICAELGAGAGSMAAWLADRVGARRLRSRRRPQPQPLCRHLSERPNVAAPRSRASKPSSSNPRPTTWCTPGMCLMHLDDADRVIAKIVGALRPGGRLLLEEADYYALAGITSAVFARVVSPLVGRWTWARTMPITLSRLPVVDLQVTVDASMLHGASDEAAFWAHTIMSARDRITRLPEGSVAGSAVSAEDIDQVQDVAGRSRRSGPRSPR